jgi:hypothetical protein
MSDGSVRWMSYDELAAALSINRESARQLAIRKRWGRRKGNDGKARVGVPEDVLRPETGNATRPDTGPNTSESTSDHTAVVQVLTRHIERLEQELDTAREKAAESDALARQVESLKAVLEEMRQDRDRWHATATAVITRAESPAPPRPWWKRLVG